MRSVTKLLADRALGCVLSPQSRPPSLSAPKTILKTHHPPFLPNLWVLQVLRRKHFLLWVFTIPCLIKYVLSDLPLSVEGEVTGALRCSHADGAMERLLSSSGWLILWLAAISTDYIRLKRTLVVREEEEEEEIPLSSLSLSLSLSLSVFCVTHKIFLSLSGIRSPQCSAAAARRTWRPALRKALGCACSTCLRSRCSMEGRNAATATWRKERSVTVESLRWE